MLSYSGAYTHYFEVIYIFNVFDKCIPKHFAHGFGYCSLNNGIPLFAGVNGQFSNTTSKAGFRAQYRSAHHAITAGYQTCIAEITFICKWISTSKNLPDSILINQFKSGL